MGYGNVEIYEADPLLYWRNKPNQNRRTDGGAKAGPHQFAGHARPGILPAKARQHNSDSDLGRFHHVRLGAFGAGNLFGVAGETSARGSRSCQESRGHQCGCEFMVVCPNVCLFRDRALSYEPDFVVLGEANLWTQFSEKNSPDFVQKFLWRIRFKNFLRRFATIIISSKCG